MAVFGGALGCLLLLLRKSAAYYLFIASLLGVIVMLVPNLGLTDSTPDVSSFGVLAGIVASMILGVFLIWYSKQAESKGWLS